MKLGRGFILGGAGPQQHACPRTVKIACFFLALFVNDIVCANFDHSLQVQMLNFIFHQHQMPTFHLLQFFWDHLTMVATSNASETPKFES